MTNFQLFATWFKNIWKSLLVIFYFLTVITVGSIVVWQKYLASGTTVSVPTTSSVTAPGPIIGPTDIHRLQEQINRLQSDLVRQTVIIEQLEAANAGQVEANKKLDRRLQGHLEFNKRLCEYVLVITVDKKIVPRQCLPEYKWQREEGL